MGSIGGWWLTSRSTSPCSLPSARTRSAMSGRRMPKLLLARVPEISFLGQTEVVRSTCQEVPAALIHYLFGAKVLVRSGEGSDYRRPSSPNRASLFPRSLCTLFCLVPSYTTFPSP